MSACSRCGESGFETRWGKRDENGPRDRAVDPHCADAQTIDVASIDDILPAQWQPARSLPAIIASFRCIVYRRALEIVAGSRCPECRLSSKIAAHIHSTGSYAIFRL
jgi:hypothetical protein